MSYNNPNRNNGGNYYNSRYNGHHRYGKQQGYYQYGDQYGSNRDSRGERDYYGDNSSSGQYEGYSKYSNQETGNFPQASRPGWSSYYSGSQSGSSSAYRRRQDNERSDDFKDRRGSKPRDKYNFSRNQGHWASNDSRDKDKQPNLKDTSMVASAPSFSDERREDARIERSSKNNESAAEKNDQLRTKYDQTYSSEKKNKDEEVRQTFTNQIQGNDIEGEQRAAPNKEHQNDVSDEAQKSDSSTSHTASRDEDVKPDAYIEEDKESEKQTPNKNFQAIGDRSINESDQEKKPSEWGEKSNDLPRSPINQHGVADSSILSPIGDSTALQDPFFADLDTIDEARDANGKVAAHDVTEREEGSDEGDTSQDDGQDVEDDMLSEAETVITDSPPSTTQGRRLMRKKDYDEERSKLKRNTTNTSEEPDEDQQMGDAEKSRPKYKPYKLKRDSSGRSLLQRACKKGNINEVKNYLDRGADVNESDFCGFTCLHEAALLGHTDVVKLLVENGANINAQAGEVGYLETPLIDAAENKHLATVKILLQKGANPNIFNIDGHTALTKITSEHKDEDGYDDIIKLLEQACSSYVVAANPELERKDPELVSPSSSEILDDPHESYFSDLIKRKGIYRFAAEGAKELTANYFVSGNNLLSKPDILILAARNGHTELVDIILGLNSEPFDINSENECGVTALLASVGRGHYQVVESLLSKGADPAKRRKVDKLNSLEIAKRSAHFDAREIALLRDHVKKFQKLKSGLDEPAVTENDENRSASNFKLSRPNINDEYSSGDDDNDELSDKVSKSKYKKRHTPDDSDHSSFNRPKKAKSDTYIKQQTSSVFNKESTPDNNDMVKEDTQSPNQERSFSGNNSPSPAPMTKEQEELKAKSAEEARIWHEKMEAKKRARKVMFLKSEKEKERRKKEEEERKIEEEKQKVALQAEEKNRMAKEDEERSKILSKKKVSLKHELTIEQYPYGLKLAKFGVDLTDEEILKYSPLYIFELDESRFVLDMQVSLLTGASVSSIHSDLTEKKRLDSDQKSKVWSLFFSMIGIHANLVSGESVKNDFYKFQYLDIHFIKFAEAASFVKSSYVKSYTLIWQAEKFSKVSLDTIHLPKILTEDIEERKPIDPSVDDITVDEKKLFNEYFIPHNLRNRKDILKTIQMSRNHLW